MAVPVPDAEPVTRPVVLTLAISVLLLRHVPPGVELVSAVVRPLHTLSTPVIPVEPEGFIVITFVVVAVPQAEVTV